MEIITWFNTVLPADYSIASLWHAATYWFDVQFRVRSDHPVRIIERRLVLKNLDLGNLSYACSIETLLIDNFICQWTVSKFSFFTLYFCHKLRLSAFWQNKMNGMNGMNGIILRISIVSCFDSISGVLRTYRIHVINCFACGRAMKLRVKWLVLNVGCSW